MGSKSKRLPKRDGMDDVTQFILVLRLSREFLPKVDVQLTPLGIMGVQLRTPVKSFRTNIAVIFEVFLGCL